MGFPTMPCALGEEALFRFETVGAAAGTDHSFFPVNPGQLTGYIGGVKADLKKES